MLHLALACVSLLAASLGDPPTPEDKAAYQAAAANVPRDAGAHVRLACWCEANGLEDERYKHLAIALDIDPDHAAAHGLLGQVADNGAWRLPQAVGKHIGGADKVQALATYRARRAKIPDTALAHWQLASWCEENGLKAEAVAHLTAVVRLDSSRQDAWKKLGYRQQKGLWTTVDLADAVRAEAEAQHKADARWRPLLKKWKQWLDRKVKRADAEAALAGVHDPRAVPSILTVSGPAVITQTGGGPQPQYCMLWEHDKGQPPMWGKCFACGTPVLTPSGPQAIETLRDGDLVLTYDGTQGLNRTAALVSVHHVPAARTLRLVLGGETIVTTDGHPFLTPGGGWTRAGDLRPGDDVLARGGRAHVEAREVQEGQTVWNVRLAGSSSFLVGRSGLVVHDLSPIAD